MRVALATLLLLAACTTTQTAAPSLAGTAWTLQTLPGQTVNTAQHAPSLDFETSRAHGSAGCNSWSADFTQSGANLRFGSPLHTMMACVNGMDVERAFMSAIDATRSAGVAGDVLVLRDGSGRELARFFRSSNAVPPGS